MKHISIVPIQTEDDIRGNAYVHYKSWHETYADLIDAEYLNTFTLEKCNKIAYHRKDNVLVAKDGNTVVGFVGYGKARDEMLSDCGEIYSIYVLQEFQGQKIGYRLMKEALSMLSDYTTVVLWVLKENDRAIRFYEKLGFRFDGTEQELMLGTARTECRMIRKNT